MSNSITNLKEELNTIRYEYRLIQKIDCSKEDNKKYRKLSEQGLPLPEGVYEYKTEDGYGSGEYYTIHIPTELSKEERMEYIQLLQLQKLKTIKSCIVFFTTFSCYIFNY